MGTRQEIGIFVLVILLALPAVFYGNEDQPDQMQLAAGCPIPVEVIGEVDSPGVVCVSPQMRAEDLAELVGTSQECAFKQNFEPGQLLAIVNADLETCRFSKKLMPGKHRVLFNLRIPINQANVHDLEAIPGIGPALALRIVNARAAMGGFNSLDDLDEVKGIGPKKLAKLKEYLDL
ncbi:MAG: ComEA family DNA-binding protein [Deltaproteobacteria bacterium]|nr:ComEA family DNA-binding protein [Deltaproteobacteria bacterium]